MIRRTEARTRPRSQRIAIQVVVSFVDLSGTRLVPDDGPGTLAGDIRTAVTTLVSNALWIVSVLRSRRLKLTFVRRRPARPDHLRGSLSATRCPSYRFPAVFREGVKVMIRYLVVGLGSGILFGVMDGIFHANPLAERLYRVYGPIARESMNVVAGSVLDIAYGFALAGMFLLVRGSLPFASGALDGLVFGAGLWFLRVVMDAASQWIMFRIPAATLLYSLAYGLVEMLALGVVYGVTL